VRKSKDVSLFLSDPSSTMGQNQAQVTEIEGYLQPEPVLVYFCSLYWQPLQEKGPRPPPIIFNSFSFI